MFKKDDLQYLCCPVCRSDLALRGELLSCTGCKNSYPIVDGIPRLLPPQTRKYNSWWDYKWFVLDAGIGYNYWMLDKKNPAYKEKCVYRYFDEDVGEYWKAPKSSIAIDVGCGIGQYSVALLETGNVDRVIAIDLTRGVDVGARILRKKRSKNLQRIVFVQADARFLPIKTGVIELSTGLAALHHTGNMQKCLDELVRVTKSRRKLLVWIYTKPMVEQVGDSYRNVKGWFSLCAHLAYLAQLELVYSVLRQLPTRALVPLLKVFASDTVFFLRRIPVIGYLFKFLFPAVPNHPDKRYRLINLYDGYSARYSEHFSEFDVFEWSKKYGFKILAFTPHRLGFVGEKRE